jgi:quercetin dioxygenase-like cupin family protein
MSTSTLSRLESGKRQATLELLVPLTRQLGIGLDDLVTPPVSDPRVRRPVVRRNGLVIAPLAPEDAPIATYKITYPPTSTPPEPRIHDGYEWLYVLSGKLRLVLGDQELILTRTEAAEFDTRIPHSMSAVGTRPAQVISIFNNDGIRMHTHVGTIDQEAGSVQSD